MSIFSTIRERYKIQKGEDIREVSFKDLQSAEPVNDLHEDKLVTDLMSLETGLEKSSAIKFAKGIRALHDSAAVHIPDDIDKQRNSMKM